MNAEHGKAGLSTIHTSFSERDGCTGRISARGLALGLYRKDREPIFSQHGREQARLIRDLLHD